MTQITTRELGKHYKKGNDAKIQNRVTKEVVEVEALFAQTACEMVDWVIGNCYVKLFREGPFTNIEEKPETPNLKGELGI